MLWLGASRRQVKLKVKRKKGDPAIKKRERDTPGEASERQIKGKPLKGKAVRRARAICEKGREIKERGDAPSESKGGRTPLPSLSNLPRPSHSSVRTQEYRPQRTATAAGRRGR